MALLSLIISRKGTTLELMCSFIVSQCVYESLRLSSSLSASSFPPLLSIHLSLSFHSPTLTHLCLFISSSFRPVYVHLSFSSSLSLSSSPATINHSPVGCWSVRNGRSDGFSQLLQASQVHLTALPSVVLAFRLADKIYRTWINIWAALMCAWFI